MTHPHTDLTIGKRGEIQRGSTDVAQMIVTNHNHAQMVRDRSMFIAAPELLSSLRHLRAFWKPGSNHDTDEVQHALAAADAAIAKAEGRS